MPSYTINEPHPTVPQHSYTQSGRGGRGNIFKVSEPTTSPAGVPTKATTTATTGAPSTARFFTGRGGVGNVKSPSQRASTSFDEYFAEAVRQESSSRGYGRGGAGNYASKKSSEPATVEDAKTKSRRDSSSTSGSERSGFWGRLSTSSRR